jgi:glycosyltransferase involved in cell wall biosynthesis
MYGRANAFVGKVEELLANGARRYRIGENGRVFARTKFPREVSMEKLEETLMEVAEGVNRP